METLLYIIFFVSCLVLVATVLLQPGKTDAGALFTSGVSSAALNPRGTQSVLSKITIGAATVFMLSALMLSLPAITGDRSVLETQGTEGEPSADANSNVNATSNTNSLPASNANSGGSPPPPKKEEDAGKETTVEKKADSTDKPVADESDKQKD